MVRSQADSARSLQIHPEPLRKPGRTGLFRNIFLRTRTVRLPLLFSDIHALPQAHLLIFRQAAVNFHIIGLGTCLDGDRSL